MASLSSRMMDPDSKSSRELRAAQGQGSHKLAIFGIAAAIVAVAVIAGVWYYNSGNSAAAAQKAAQRANGR